MVKEICEELIKLSEKYPNTSIMTLIKDAIVFNSPTAYMNGYKKNNFNTNSFVLTCLQKYSKKK